jgi:RimJ/RimL family protein N-acetyltransferase
MFGMLTGRLLMRRWRDADREPFAALNADPLVMAAPAAYPEVRR